LSDLGSFGKSSPGKKPFVVQAHGKDSGKRDFSTAREFRLPVHSCLDPLNNFRLEAKWSEIRTEFTLAKTDAA
jgi:hypothetical protein